MKVITPAGDEPITLEMARKQCKIDADTDGVYEDDDLLEVWISAAREWCESYLGRIIAPTLVEITLDAFPATSVIELESGPVIEVNSIIYTDVDGVEQGLDSSVWRLDTTDSVAVLRLNNDQSWPETDDTTDVVRIRYTVGYTAAGDSPATATLPNSIKAAMLLLIRHLYDNRSSTTEQNLSLIPMGVTTLLSPYKLRKGFA